MYVLTCECECLQKNNEVNTINLNLQLKGQSNLKSMFSLVPGAILINLLGKSRSFFAKDLALNYNKNIEQKFLLLKLFAAPVLLYESLKKVFKQNKKTTRGT